MRVPAILAARLLVAATAALSLTTLAATAEQQKMLKVDWGNKDIKSYVDEQKKNPTPSVLAKDEGRLGQLKLPVIGFERPPGQLAQSLGVSASEPPKRKLIMDESNPVWYQIIERYGDLTITIDADLRLQQELAPSAKVFSRLPSPDENVKVQYIDGTTEPGMEGALAEYVVYKFPNIPYRVTIECTAKTREYCRNPGAITKDAELLKLISARPPQ